MGGIRIARPGAGAAPSAGTADARLARTASTESASKRYDGTTNVEHDTLLFLVPSGLADGLALKESRYAGGPAIRPWEPWPQSGSPIALASGRLRRFGLGDYRQRTVHERKIRVMAVPAGQENAAAGVTGANPATAVDSDYTPQQVAELLAGEPSPAGRRPRSPMSTRPAGSPGPPDRARRALGGGRLDRPRSRRWCSTAAAARARRWPPRPSPSRLRRPQHGRRHARVARRRAARWSPRTATSPTPDRS